MYLKKNILLHLITITLLLLLTNVFSAEKIYCDQCENEIRPGSSYLAVGEKIFCSAECYEKTLPKCSVCGEPLRNGGFESKGKMFCSEKCYKTTWNKCHLCGKSISSGYHFNDNNEIVFCSSCMELPKCFNCGHPTDHRKLLDGRYICTDCDKTSIDDPEAAYELIAEVREVMEKKMKLHTAHKIDYKLVDVVSLKKESETEYSEGFMEQGLFVNEQRIKTIVRTKSILGIEFDKNTEEETKNAYRILMLYSLPRDKFIEVAAHELAHDWMQENYPNIADLKISEGWAEFVATQVNNHYGNTHLNTRMKNNPDPVYGEGYRYVAGYAKEHGVSGLYKLFEEMNKK